jgi:hypothetical protein
MDPLFRAVVVGLVPQPQQIPPPPFAPEDLQRAYFDVSREHAYQQFQFLPGDAGAQFLNSPEDGLVIQPGLIQFRSVIDSTPEVARERTLSIMRVLTKRLEVLSFLQVGIKIVAHVPVQGSARSFIADRLMRGTERIEELGPGFFAGGVKYRNIEQTPPQEEVLLIEPFVQDDNFLFVDYDTQRPQQFELDQLAGWLDDGFSFVRGPAMDLLKTEG